MKLELKHLAPYLPYGLTNQRTFHTPQKIDGIVGNKVYFGDTVLFISQVEPILRPLSDLKNIISNGVGLFVPIDYFENKFPTLNLHCQCESLIEDERWINDSDYLLVQYLLEWHFDIFGLITEGLAIDINTLK